MPTISFISPKLIVKKFTNFLKPQNTKKEPEIKDILLEKPVLKGKKALSKNQIKTEEVQNPVSDKGFLSNPKLHVSMKDMKIISASLMHFKKYLLTKGQADKAAEVEEVDKRFYEFIMYLHHKSKQ